MNMIIKGKLKSAYIYTHVMLSLFFFLKCSYIKLVLFMKITYYYFLQFLVFVRLRIFRREKTKVMKKLTLF